MNLVFRPVQKKCSQKKAKNVRDNKVLATVSEGVRRIRIVGIQGANRSPKTVFSEFVTGGDEQTLAGVARSDGHACESTRTALCRH